MTYFAKVVKIDNLNPIPNADRIQFSVIFGSPVVIGKNVQLGDLMIYFPSDGRLSPKYLSENNLYRHSVLNKDQTVTGYFEDNGRVRIQKIRKQISDGLVEPLTSLAYTGKVSLKEGDTFTDINGQKICEKYINEKTARAANQKSGRTSAKWKFPLFREHFETQQLRFYINSILPESRIIITEKLHGTSHRITRTLKDNSNWFTNLSSKFGIVFHKWEVVNGTRRTVLSDGMVDGYYGKDFRKFVDDHLRNKLAKGETVYGEIVGWVSENKPIMGVHNVEKLQDKELLKRYGKNMTYTYGNKNGDHTFYVYRITLTNEDGYEVELSWEQVQKRCGELNLDPVPELHTDKFILGDAYRTPYEDYTDLIGLCEILSDDHSTLDFTHLREGVCVRVENKFGTSIYKHKSHNFKIMEDIEKIDNVDMEESS